MSWLDIVIATCIAIGLIRGLIEGFVKQVVSFLALIIAIFFSGQLARFMYGKLLYFNVLSSMSPGVLSGLCYILAFVLIITVIVLIGKVVNIAIKMTPAQPLNSMLGGLFGMLIWIFSLSILINIFSVFDVNSTILTKETQEKSILYTRVKNVAPTVYPILRDYFKQ